MPWTIQKLLNWTAQHFTEKGLESPRLCAELLLAEVLGLTRIELYTGFDQVVEKPQLERLRGLVRRAAGNEPIAYLTGAVEFYSLRIAVGPPCVIPRPETELLVERAIKFLRGREGPQFVCDLCTGSGCVAVAIASNLPGARIIATDVCDKALNFAAENVAAHGVSDRVSLVCGDLFAPVVPQLDTRRFDLVTANPPYVSRSQFESLASNVKDYEPKLGLFAGEDGLDVIRRIIRDSPAFLKEGGRLILEIGHGQSRAVWGLLEEAGFGSVTVEKDPADIDRVATAVNS
jgi:release factor glutamine methyltransferase